MSNRRRSQRVLLRIPVVVIAHGPDKKPTIEQTHTLVVSAHGGLLHLSLKVKLAQIVGLRNPETAEEQACRVAFVNDGPDGKTEVGVEFLQAAPNFWRVQFPPSDWAPLDPELTADKF